ncbi:TPA: phage tail protein [Citrobacter freundii]|nr:phage tail protein [Citrobacter freundii]HCL6562619.1 phage tail protein [Citrobacter freundii]HED3639862.1 phage tail protein [Citrobacter freundii]HED3677520.1 phage tail protein [Citrobacter freundii]
MSAGTLTLTNNSAAVAGNGTAFTTEVAAGDFIVVTVGGVPYTLPIKSVESGTALTLVSNFTGPTQSGAAWSAVPRVALNMVTAALVAQSAEALRGLNYDKQNWQQVFSGTGNITVKLPDGSSYSGPAWGGIITTLDGKAGAGANNDITSLSGLTTPLSMDQGGLGAKDAAGGRIKLGLGTAATKNAGAEDGDVMPVGAYGVGKSSGAIITNETHTTPLLNDHFVTKNLGICSFRNDQNITAGDPPFHQWSPSLFWRSGDTFACLNVHYADGTAQMFSGVINDQNLISSTNGRTLWDTRNTTVDSSGFIKKASPVVKLFGDGRYETNNESEGVLVTRLACGSYLITGCTGLNSDAAWGGIDGGFEIPVDRNKQPRIWLDYKVNADGSVMVMTYHRIYQSAPLFAQNRIGKADINGVFTEMVADCEPVDIPADSFVSVRVEMPDDSIWNQKQTAIRAAMEKADRERQQNKQQEQL